MIQLKIAKDENVEEYIPLIRKIDRIIMFRTLVDTLTQNGVSIQAFLDEEQISLEILYNLLEILQQIKIEDNYRRITI